MLIALGGNATSQFGSPIFTLREALRALEARGALIRDFSEWYRSPAFPVGSGPDYINAVVLVDAPWSPEHALRQLHDVEEGFGRVRAERWGERTLDLDLLAVGSAVSPDVTTYQSWVDLPLRRQKELAPSELILPHPRIQDRAFVLVPLCDVAPDWMHPVFRRTAKQMLDDLPASEKAKIKVAE